MLFFITMFFIALKLFYFFFGKEVNIFTQRYQSLSRRLKKEKAKEGKSTLLLPMTPMAICCVLYLLSDFVFLFYCILLMFYDATWQLACILLLIAALSSYAIHGRISGTYERLDRHTIYPKFWFRQLMSGVTLIILYHIATLV